MQYLIEISPKSSLLVLLNALDDLMKTDKTLQIDLRGTKNILVKSSECVHCGRQIPVYTPLSRYNNEALRCNHCEQVCVHSYESDRPIIKTITQYSFKSPPKILCLTLEELGLFNNSVLSVIDRFGNKYEVLLK